MSTCEAKILVFGNFEDKFIEAIKKLNALHNSKNGPFSFAIFNGNLDSIDNDDLATVINGEILIDVPLYVYGSSDLGSENPKNLNILNKPCITKENFRIVHCNTVATNTTEDISQELADIFISDKWPQDIDRFTNGASVIPQYQSLVKDTRTKSLAILLKPRYHFTSCKDIFWERPPYCNPSSDRITRFISLAKYGGSQKWFYAFKMSNKTTHDQIKNITECPYKIKEDEEKEESVKRKFDRGDIQNPRKKRERAFDRPPKVRPEACFFCLSNPRLDKNLIISIAEESYLALDKGPLSSTTSRAKLGFDGHILFIPIGHVPTLNFLPEDARNVINLEQKKYLIGLEKMFTDRGLRMATFEISRSKGIHFHTQVIAILPEQVENIKKSIIREINAVGLQVESRDIQNDEGDYVRFTVDKQVFVISFKNFRQKFDFQLCRRAIALGMEEPDKIDWKFCVRNSQQEVSEADKFKKEFAQYDFSL